MYQSEAAKKPSKILQNLKDAFPSKHNMLNYSWVVQGNTENVLYW